AVHRLAGHLVHVDELLRLLADQQLQRLRHFYFAQARRAASAAEHRLQLADVEADLIHPRRGEDLEHAVLRLGDRDLDLAIVELAGAQEPAQLLARRRIGGRRDITWRR